MHGSGTRLGAKLQGIVKRAGWALLAFLLLVPTDLFGQTPSPRAAREYAGFSASAATSYQFKSNLDGGGDVSVSRLTLGVGGTRPLSDRAGLLTRLTYNRDEYDFSNLNAFPGGKPWQHVNSLGLTLRLDYRLDDHWSLGAGPTFAYAGEDGANFGDSLQYGGIAGAVYRVNPDLMVGFGAGVFYRLEETVITPTLLISWKITDRLRLGNSYRLGLTGPAGLELSYKLDENWEVAGGGGARSSRFRLDKEGSAPGGVGENHSWPVYARISRKIGPVLHLDLYGGAAFAGKMVLQDSRGNDIRSVDYKTAPIMGAYLRAAF